MNMTRHDHTTKVIEQRVKPCSPASQANDLEMQYACHLLLKGACGQVE